MFICNRLQIGQSAINTFGVQFFSSNYSQRNSFASSGRALGLPFRAQASFQRQFCHRLPVFSRVRSSVVHSRRRIPHHCLASAHSGGECPFPINFVTFARQLVPHALPEAVFHHHIVTAERVLAKPRRLQRRLNIHFEVHQVRDKLRVRLRLVPAPHDSERHAHISLLRKRRNDGVQRPLSSRQRIWRICIHAEESAAIVQRKSRAGGDDA